MVTFAEWVNHLILIKTRNPEVSGSLFWIWSERTEQATAARRLVREENGTGKEYVVPEKGSKVEQHPCQGCKRLNILLSRKSELGAWEERREKELWSVCKMKEKC